MGEAWYATLTGGPRAGFDVIRPHYAEHVLTGSAFIPGAGAAGRGFQVTTGLGGAAKLARYTRTPTGKAAFVLQKSKRAADVKLGKQLGSARYALNRFNLIGTGNLLQEEEYVRAGVSWWGPPGTLTVLDVVSGMLSNPNTTNIVKVYSQRRKGISSKPVRSKKLKTTKKSSSRFGKSTTWCKRHKRYDRCR